MAIIILNKYNHVRFHIIILAYCNFDNINNQYYSFSSNLAIYMLF